MSLQANTQLDNGSGNSPEMDIIWDKRNPDPYYTISEHNSQAITHYTGDSHTEFAHTQEDTRTWNALPEKHKTLEEREQYHGNPLNPDNMPSIPGTVQVKRAVFTNSNSRLPASRKTKANHQPQAKKAETIVTVGGSQASNNGNETPPPREHQQADIAAEVLQLQNELMAKERSLKAKERLLDQKEKEANKKASQEATAKACIVGLESKLKELEFTKQTLQHANSVLQRSTSVEQQEQQPRLSRDQGNACGNHLAPVAKDNTGMQAEPLSSLMLQSMFQQQNTLNQIQTQMMMNQMQQQNSMQHHQSMMFTQLNAHQQQMQNWMFQSQLGASSHQGPVCSSLRYTAAPQPRMPVYMMQHTRPPMSPGMAPMMGPINPLVPPSYNQVYPAMHLPAQYMNHASGTVPQPFSYPPPIFLPPAAGGTLNTTGTFQRATSSVPAYHAPITTEKRDPPRLYTKQPPNVHSAALGNWRSQCMKTQNPGGEKQNQKNADAIGPGKCYTRPVTDEHLLGAVGPEQRGMYSQRQSDDTGSVGVHNTDLSQSSNSTEELKSQPSEEQRRSTDTQHRHSSKDTEETSQQHEETSSSLEENNSHHKVEESGDNTQNSKEEPTTAKKSSVVTENQGDWNRGRTLEELSAATGGHQNRDKDNGGRDE